MNLADLMDFLSRPELGLMGLFISSFLAATLLPGGSELILFALLRLRPETLVVAVILATLGNTLGGMSTWWLARQLPEQALARLSPRHLHWLRRWGPAALTMAWAPLAGDALCAAAGWLRLAALPCALWMGLGKGLRYSLVAAGALAY